MTFNPRRDSARTAGVTLVEILLAAAILVVLGVTVQGSMAWTLRGVRIDRFVEAKRHVVLDLIEFLCRPETPVADLFSAEEVPPGGTPPPVSGDAATALSREITIDEALDMIGLRSNVEPAPEGLAEEREVLKKILIAGQVEGFRLDWTRNITPGVQGNPNDPLGTLRLDRLDVRARIKEGHQGAQFTSSRVFAVLTEPPEGS